MRVWRTGDDELSGYSSIGIHDDLSVYDDQPHVVVDDKYYVEPAYSDMY